MLWIHSIKMFLCYIIIKQYFQLIDLLKCINSVSDRFILRKVIEIEIKQFGICNTSTNNGVTLFLYFKLKIYFLNFDISRNIPCWNWGFKNYKIGRMYLVNVNVNSLCDSFRHHNTVLFLTKLKNYS